MAQALGGGFIICPVPDPEKVTVMCPCCGTIMEYSPDAIHALLLSLHISASCPETGALFTERA